MNSNKYLWDEFLEFETKNSLFDIKDENGIYIWDILRYHIWGKIVYANIDIKGEKLNRLSMSWITSKIVHIFDNLWLLFSRKKYINLFLLFSRSIFNDEYFDQNAYDVLQILKEEDSLLLELNRPIYSNQYKKRYKKNYHFFLNTMIFIYIFSAFHIIKTGRFDYLDALCLVIKKGYPQIKINKDNLIVLIKGYYVNKYLYEKILKRHCIKKVFYINTGVEKGIVSAAKNCHIPVYEFQHGVIDRGHMYYSYPLVKDLWDKVYLPTKLLTFSRYWLKGIYYPSRELVIGNNYISKKIVKEINCDIILFVSANVFGDKLAYLLNQAANKIKSNIIFKLHSNEYDQVDFYKTLFLGNKNIRVITNECSINELLAKARLMVTVFSTAVYEALQASVPVCIFKVETYEIMNPVFELDGVFLINGACDFLNVIDQIKPLENSPVFFESFNPDVVRKELIG
ncbi:hypothetical protein AGMMS4952_22130 [Spirochaetia bacterium]|nr:hypothetical protein AGMMS4952_22130 [Spirochaetia bacterium]